MKLIICGNGFDKHLRLKTDYFDYKEYLKESVFINGKNAISVVENSLFFVDREVDCWSDLELALTFDYEKYIRYWCEAFNDGEKDFISLEDRKQRDIFRKIRESDPRSIAFDFTNNWFLNWICKEYYSRYKKIKKNYIGPMWRVIDPNDMYLTFNYTPTLEDVFGINNNRILYIHNRIFGKDSANLTNNIEAQLIEQWNKKIQFGSTKNIWKDWERTFDSIRINENGEWLKQKLKKDLSNICYSFSKSLSENYDVLQSFIKGNKDIDEVVVLGHSILGIDEPYYKDIIVPLLGQCKWSIYCYKGDKGEANRFVKKYGIKNPIYEEW